MKHIAIKSGQEFVSRWGQGCVDDSECTTIAIRGTSCKGGGIAHLLFEQDLSPKFPKLIILTLCSNDIDSSGAISFIYQLTRCQFLKLICLARNVIDDPGFKTIFQNLPRFLALEYLDMANNQIENIESDQIQQQQEFAGCKLKALNLAYMPNMTGAIEEADRTIKKIDGLIMLVPRLPFLEHLDLSGNSHIATEDLMRLVECTGQSNSLKILNLNDCALDIRVLTALTLITQSLDNKLKTVGVDGKNISDPSEETERMQIFLNIIVKSNDDLCNLKPTLKEERSMEALKSKLNDLGYADELIAKWESDVFINSLDDLPDDAKDNNHLENKYQDDISQTYQGNISQNTSEI
jgi:hypothetical protein